MRQSTNTQHPRHRWPAALLALLLGLSATLLVACGQKPLLDRVTVVPAEISPNADGQDDVARITFYLNENAKVSFILTDAEGQQFIFREATPVSVNEDPYAVYFSGVVEGYRLPTDDDDVFYEIRKRVLQDGVYTWSLYAIGESGRESEITGTLTIRDADTQLPGIRGFTVSPPSFSPNQDGINDRVTINLVLEKDVEELRVYLKGVDGIEHPIAEDERVTQLNKAGWHTYDYDGGIDAGSQPPADGTYKIYAEARDAVGQHVIISNTLTIHDAGLPRAYILNGDVEYSLTTMVISETLCFTLTVENDSDTHLRTIGPWPGTEYRSDQNFNTLGWSEESGTFRVAMDYDTSLRNYPFRWGIGTPGVDLVEIDGFYYLPPRARSLVTGCVQVVEVPVRNPLYYWMGLIHEDVAISHVNNRVDPNYVTIWEP
jgi:hypothetical protein